jgi:hypothetical protein
MPVGVDYFAAVEHLIHLSRIAHAKLKPAGFTYDSRQPI